MSKDKKSNLRNRMTSRQRIKRVAKYQLLRHPSFWLWVGQILLAIVLAALTVVFLRQNNLNMVTLRNGLVEADKTGDIALVESAARKLQDYVAHHMNTTAGRIALQTVYDQAAKQAMASARPAWVDEQTFQQITDGCLPQYDNYGYRAWATCVATQMGLTAAQTLTIADDIAPDPDLFYVEYVSTRWSADPAGICLLLLVVDVFFLGVRMLVVAVKWLFRYCRNRFQKEFTGVDRCI